MFWKMPSHIKFFWYMVCLYISVALTFFLFGIADAANPFDFFNFFSDKINTKAGEIVTVEKQLSKLSFPIKFTIAGDLPQGEVDCFAMLGFNENLVALERDAATNPFDQKSWKPTFVNWMDKDKLREYSTVTVSGNKFTFTGYSILTKDQIVANKVFTLLFAIAPKGEVQKWDISHAHIVRVNIK